MPTAPRVCDTPCLTNPPTETNRRVWRTWSLATGSDVTWGVIDAMAEALGVTQVELEGPELLACDLPGVEGYV